MKNKEGRPEWFRFWRRTCKQLDIEQLTMDDRGIVFTNMMRYFDSRDLLPMTPLQDMAFNLLKISIDESFASYEERAEKNRMNGAKGGRPPKPKETEKTQMVIKKPKKPEDRRKKIEDRSINSIDLPKWMKDRIENDG